MPVELLEPWAVERNDFLARFVARHGAGPHHLTFKVASLDAALERVRGAGFHPGEHRPSPTRVERSVPDAGRGARHRRAARGVARPSRDARRAARARRGERSQHAPALVDRSVTGRGRARAPAPRRVAHADARRPRSSSSPACSKARSSASRTQRVDLVWPRGARIGLEHRPDAPPGVDRLEVEGLRRGTHRDRHAVRPGLTRRAHPWNCSACIGAARPRMHRCCRRCMHRHFRMVASRLARSGKRRLVAASCASTASRLKPSQILHMRRSSRTAETPTPGAHAPRATHEADDVSCTRRVHHRDRERHDDLVVNVPRRGEAGRRPPRNSSSSIAFAAGRSAASVRTKSIGISAVIVSP